MKFKSFKLTDEEGINAFLAEHEDEVLLEGSRFTDGLVCYMYGPKDQKVLEREFTEDLLKKTAANLIAKIVEFDVDERMARGNALNARKGATEQVMEAAEQKIFFVRQLTYIREIIKENAKGEWMEKMATSSGVSAIEVIPG